MPLYDKIISYVMDKIKSGELKVGDMLPTEIELSKEFKVSRPTVRTALLKLVNEGYLTRVKGIGTFVAKPKLLQESTIFIESFAEEMKNKGLEIKTEVLEFRVIPASELVASKLNIKVNDMVIKLKRLRYVKNSFDKGPIVLTSLYLPEKIANPIMKYNMEDKSLHTVLRENGIEVCTLEKELGIRMLNGKTSRLLGAEENSAAVYVTSVAYDQNGRAIDYCESYYPSDRNKFFIKIKI